MSFKDKVLLGLCKDIIRNQDRLKIRIFLTELLKNKKYDYYTRNLRTQFFSFLDLDSRREEIIARGVPLDIQILSQSEKEMLKNLQDDLIQLNIDCIEHAFGNSNTSFRDALIPYTLYNVPPTPIDRTYFFLNKKLVNEVKEEFAKTSAVKFFKRNTTLVNFPQAGTKQLVGIIHAVQQELNSTRFGKNPSLIEELSGPIQLNDSQRAILNSLSLVSIRKQLEVMNQLIYQACLSDRLVSFSEENIFYVDSQSSNYLSSMIEISTEFEMEASVLSPGDIIYISLETQHYQIKSIYLTWGIELSMNREIGSQINLKLLCIDDDLNPYGNLYKIYQ